MELKVGEFVFSGSAQELEELYRLRLKPLGLKPCALLPRPKSWVSVLEIFYEHTIHKISDVTIWEKKYYIISWNGVY